MTFEYKYREAGGALKWSEVEAANRSEAYARLRERGISPLEMCEGRAHVASATRNGRDVSTRRPWPRYAWCGCVVAVLAGLGLYCALRERRPPTSPASVPPVRAQRPAKPVRKAPVVRVASTNVVRPQTNVVVKPPANEYEARFPGQKILSIETNATGYIMLETEAPDGRRTTRVLQPKTIFKHATDELIMVALTTPAGREIPPLPNMGGARADLEFRRSLETPILIEPEDSERVKAIKQIVKSVRVEINDRMQNGEHFADIIYDHCKLRNENDRVRSDAQRELRKLVEEGDEVSAREYEKAINEQFRKMGIAEISAESNRRVMKKGKSK